MSIKFRGMAASYIQPRIESDEMKFS